MHRRKDGCIQRTWVDRKELRYVHLTSLAEADHKQGEKDEKIETVEQERQLKINFRGKTCY